MSLPRACRYDNLSKDPNSLANLDQDLPNYAQQSVPIYSLPQEWLWCESWCGNATKAAAKTIDLCNNPQTKEPKLEGARRIVSEWVELDEAVRVSAPPPGLLASRLVKRPVDCVPPRCRHCIGSKASGEERVTMCMHLGNRCCSGANFAPPL